MDIKSIFEKAHLKNYIISNSEEETKDLLKIADDLLQEELDNPDSNLKERFENGCIKSKYISKAIITENYNGVDYKRPVVDFVQQGGGMYGIALVGYTYILEKAGIRFYSHAGTSAGAINAILLMAICKDIYKQESIFNKGQPALKSEILAHIISNTDFSSFMDRSGIVGSLQKHLLRHRGLFGWLSIILLSIFGICVYMSFGFIFNIENGLSGREQRWYDLLTAAFGLMMVLVFSLVLLIKVLGYNFGINPGNKLQDWAEGLLGLFGVTDNQSLNRIKNKCQIDPMPVESGNIPISSTDPRLVTITTNLTHNRIVKFPERAERYWSSPEKVKPAAFLRATMSVPFVFKIFIPVAEKDYHNYDSAVDKIKLKARFVDGGMLSNFPIREFHRSDNQLPRFPTFGVLLSDIGVNNRETEKIVEERNQKFDKHGVLSFIKSFFTTFRYFYDFDYIFNQKEIKMLVRTVNTKNYNWLNFWMGKKEKYGLFSEGALKAIEQLKTFDWSVYLDERENMLKKN